MNNEVFSQLQVDEQILTFDVSDDAIERAAITEQQAITWLHCTHAWHYCDWPQ
jgi:hypothetical protein